jgi:hypothetical protein
MPYNMEESRKAFEVIRQLLLEATNETLDVSVIVGDSGLTAIISDEQERIEFISKRGGKEWMLSDEAKLAGQFTITGVAVGDGDLTFIAGGEIFTVTPTASDDNVAIATALITAVNGSSSTWTANTTGAGIVRMVPLVDGQGNAKFVTTSGDTGVTLDAKDPTEAPIDIQLGGTAKLNGRNAIFQGSAFRTPTP